MRIKDDEGHLGGYVIGQPDIRTMCPLLWAWYVDQLMVRTVLDVGCGLGHAVRWFHEHGAHALGVDGSESAIADSVAPHYCARHDFRDGAIRWQHNETFDLVWSAEFVEHVHEDFVPNIMQAFARSRRYLLMTHATPGQGGHHHVNEQPAEYWIDAVERYGFLYEPQLTEQARERSRLEPGDQGLFFRRTGLVFRRTDV